jgi:anti-anti-sigma factor
MLKPAVQIHDQDGTLIAEFWDCWRLDPAPVQELRTRYDDHLKKNGRPTVVIDLSGVGYAGSSALGHFTALHREARKAGGRLIFCNVEPTVREVFRASRLEPLFEFASDRENALAAIDQPPAKPAEPSKTGAAQAPPKASPLGGYSAPSPLRRRKPETEAK